MYVVAFTPNVAPANALSAKHKTLIGAIGELLKTLDVLECDEWFVAAVLEAAKEAVDNLENCRDKALMESEAGGCNWPAPLTPDNCGCSQIACNIVNNTFLSLDGFESMRKQMAGTEYTAEHFGAELARIADREMGELLTALEALANIGEGGRISIHETGKPTWHALDAVKEIARGAIAKAKPLTAPNGWASVEA